jgi:hypothetical protein
MPLALCGVACLISHPKLKDKEKSRNGKNNNKVSNNRKQSSLYFFMFTSMEFVIKVAIFVLYGYVFVVYQNEWF